MVKNSKKTLHIKFALSLRGNRTARKQYMTGKNGDSNYETTPRFIITHYERNGKCFYFIRKSSKSIV